MVQRIGGSRPDWICAQMSNNAQQGRREQLQCGLPPSLRSVALEIVAVLAV